MDIPYQEINSKTIDRWVEEGWEWGKPVSHEEYEKAKAGTWDVKLTPVKFVPHSWLGELKGKRVLGAGLRRRAADAHFRRAGGAVHGTGLFAAAAGFRENGRGAGGL